METSEKIKYFRKTLNISQQTLALGICSTSYLSKIENGQTVPSEDILQLLGKRLGVDLDDENHNQELELLIDDWTKSILFKDVELARNLYTKLKNSTITNIEHRLRFTLSQTLFYLMVDPKPRIAKKHFNEVIILEDLFKNKSRLYFFLVKGVSCYYEGKYSESYKALLSAENLIFLLKLHIWEKGYLYYLLGLVTNMLWKNIASLDYTRIALKHFEENYLFKRCADCRILLGIINQRIENWEEAIRQFELAATIANAFDDDKLKGSIYQNLGYIESKREHSESAINYYKQSLDYKQNQPSLSQVKTVYSLIKEYANLNNSHEGMMLVEKGLKLTQGNKSLLEFNILISYYHLVFSLGKNHSTTFEYLKSEVIQYFEQKQNWVYLAEFYQVAAKYYENEFKYKQSSTFYSKAIMAMNKLN
ncbi:helix-turn-helix domain-containing protein [Fictibacillus nanhaiensis]|uniref:helix-turn-helix domain-containing protein n=1 Tax=Fictibacillus nanhaiensis TaxID=742169 RepID=UPI003C180529